jgi:hypothetical protein
VLLIGRIKLNGNMQTKLFSFIESVTNILVGYTINLTAQVLIFPLFNIYISLDSNIKIGLIFTVISLCRSYIIRRLFN